MNTYHAEEITSQKATLEKGLKDIIKGEGSESLSGKT